MDITIKVTDEQKNAVMKLGIGIAGVAPDGVSLEDIAQKIFNDRVDPLVDQINAENTANLLAFLKDNPQVADAIKSKHNLDDSFKPIEPAPIQEEPPTPTPVQ